MQIETVPSNPRASEWTAERIERLDRPEVEQLRENAQKLGATAVVALCDAALSARPKSTERPGSLSALPKAARHFVSRRKAFAARGAFLADVSNGWSDVRKSDGVVVMSLWAPTLVSRDGTCSVLLWAPNVDGARPWSDTAAGQERLKHCKLALERGGGEGLLVHGVHHDGEAAEHNARTIHGVDPERVVSFRVEQRGKEYWAVWGAKAVERAL